MPSEALAKEGRAPASVEHTGLDAQTIANFAPLTTAIANDLLTDIFVSREDAVEHALIAILQIENMVNEGARHRACT